MSMLKEKRKKKTKEAGKMKRLAGKIKKMCTKCDKVCNGTNTTNVTNVSKVSFKPIKEVILLLIFPQGTVVWRHLSFFSLIDNFNFFDKKAGKLKIGL